MDYYAWNIEFFNESGKCKHGMHAIFKNGPDSVQYLCIYLSFYLNIVGYNFSLEPF